MQIQGRIGNLFELSTQQTALPGTHPLRISIGEVPISLHIPEEFLLGVASRRYREFAASGAEALPVFLKQKTAEQRDDSRFSYELDGEINLAAGVDGFDWNVNTGQPGFVGDPGIDLTLSRIYVSTTDQRAYGFPIPF